MGSFKRTHSRRSAYANTSVTLFLDFGPIFEQEAVCRLQPPENMMHFETTTTTKKGVEQMGRELLSFLPNHTRVKLSFHSGKASAAGSKKRGSFHSNEREKKREQKKGEKSQGSGGDQVLTAKFWE